MSKPLHIYTCPRAQLGQAIFSREGYWLSWNETTGQGTRSGDMKLSGEEIDFLSRLEADNLTNRQNYLNWIYELGVAKSNEGKPVASALRVTDSGVSFWWLSLLAERSPFKSNTIFIAFKLMTLERLAYEYCFDSICFYSRDKILATCLEVFCDKLDIRFVWEKIGNKETEPFRRKLPHLILAIGWLIQEFWQRIRISWRNKLLSPKTNDAEATVLTYFPNFDPMEAEEGRFKSNYWLGLHDWLNEQQKLTINWIWLYAGSSQISYEKTCLYKHKFQRKGKDNFYLAEEFLMPADLWLTFANFFKLLKSGRKLAYDNKVQAAFQLKDSALNLWPLFRYEWAKSFWGSIAMENCLNERKFARMAEAFAYKQEWGLYLCEFQAWEKVLPALWKKYNHNGPLIGYQHSTIRAMLLNYFHSPETFKDNSGSALPRPDIVAVNGPMALKVLLDQGFPEDEVVEVEAVRFGYLKNVDHSNQNRFSAKAKALLVACDVVASNSRYQLSLLAGALRQTADNCQFEKIWVKSHPFCPVEQFIDELGLSARVELVEGVIVDRISQATHVFTANSTSVALEALILGKQAASCISLEQINLSPLLGLKEGFMIRSTSDLVNFLQSPVKTSRPEDCYFNFENPFSNILHYPK